MDKLTLHFYEVEHDEDLEPILEDLGKSGATIVSSRINDEAEVASVTFTVADKPAFIAAFKATDSYEWLN